MGISLILGGSEPLPGWFGALMQWKLKLKWAFACVKEGVKACQDAKAIWAMPKCPGHQFEWGFPNWLNVSPVSPDSPFLLDSPVSPDSPFSPFEALFLTLFVPGILVLIWLGGGQICPHPLKMGVMGGRFKNWVGTSYLTKIDARHEDLQLSDT